MNILIVSQYFWPENFRINDLVFELKKRKHNITVLTGIPSYPSREKFTQQEIKKKFEDIDLIRVPLFERGNNNFTLMLNYISFFLSGLLFGIFKLKNKRFDIIFVFQPSPIFPVLLGVIIGRIKSCKVCSWILDLWPETLNSMGYLKNKWFKSIGLTFSNFVYGKVTLLLTQSSSMKKYLKQRLPQNNIQLLSNWVEKEFANLKPSKIRKYLKKIFFTGNIGKAQDFESLIKCFNILKTEDVSLEILGDGKHKNNILKLIETNNLQNTVIFRNPVSLSMLPKFVKKADAMIFSLNNNEIFEITIPGKFQSYLAFGLPIIGMINGESADLIRNYNVGYCVDAGDYKNLAKKIICLSNSSVKVRREMSENAQRLAKTSYSRKHILDNLEKQLKRLKS